MNCYLAMASEDIDCVIFANLVKVNNVPEIPTDDEITSSDRCDGDVQRICQRIPGDDTKFEIRCLKLQGLNGDLLNAGCLVVRCKKFLDDVGGRSDLFFDDGGDHQDKLPGIYFFKEPPAGRGKLCIKNAAENRRISINSWLPMLHYCEDL